MRIIVILIGFFISTFISHSNGLADKNAYLNTAEPVHLESLPLNKLLEMKKELPKKANPVLGPGTSSTLQRPNAMALKRRADALRVTDAAATTGSSMQTAFQISLTVLSFLAFGGYVIGLVAQNMRGRPPLQNAAGMTAPQPLKTVVVNLQNGRRPADLQLMRRPVAGTTATAVSYGRRKRSRAG